MVTSYRVPIVTTGLSLAVFAVLRLVADRQTDKQDRWNWSSKRRHYAAKVYWPSKAMSASAVPVLVKTIMITDMCSVDQVPVL